MEDRLGLPLSRFIPPYAQGLSVLVVDHDEESLAALVSMLEKCSYEVTTAALASDALSMFQQDKDKFKLVIASTKLPDIDIIPFLHAIINVNDLPIILISPTKNLSEAIKALSEGATLYLEKPIYVDDIKYLWQHAFTHKKLRSFTAKSVNINYGEKMKIIRKKSQGIVIREDGNNGANENNWQFNHGWHHNTNDKGKGKAIAQVSGWSSNRKKKAVETKERRKQIAIIRVSENTSMLNDPSINMVGKNGENEENGVNIISSNKGKEKEVGESLGGATRRRARIVWTPKLHYKFTSAISMLGEKAHPRTILAMMNEPTLTERQVYSHLQKYKSKVKEICQNGSEVSSSSGGPKSNLLAGTSSGFSQLMERRNEVARELENRNNSLRMSGNLALQYLQNNNQISGTSSGHNYGLIGGSNFLTGSSAGNQNHNLGHAFDLEKFPTDFANMNLGDILGDANVVENQGLEDYDDVLDEEEEEYFPF